MFVITVDFRVRPEHAEAFHAAVVRQAANSLALEDDCHHFDVCLDLEDEAHVFLYEIYSDEAAFKLHLESAHFRDFDATVKDWVTSKTVDSWRLQPAAEG